jgi:uncharacterized Zn finger protein
MPRKRKKSDPFRKLTWDDLEAWAGSRIVGRGRNYQHSGFVRGLTRTSDGGLLAWVEGTETYATRVDLIEDELISDCTCPYWDDCKHAVAVVLEYLDHLEKGRRVPKADPNDGRILLLEDEYGDESLDYYSEIPDYVEDEFSRADLKADLEPALNKMTKVQLIELVIKLAERFPDVAPELKERQEIAAGNVKNLIKELRREIQRVSSEPGWQNYWNGEGYTPRYSGVRSKLKRLLASGHADEVLELGKELMEAGVRQVEMSDDEGETAMEITSCMPEIFTALSRSSLSGSDQILWAVEATLSDGYGLFAEAENFLDRKFNKLDWSQAAERLLDRLNKYKPTGPKDSTFTGFYRDRITDETIRALEMAGRKDEIIPLCEQEAEKTGSYVRLVKWLRKSRRNEAAEAAIRKGILSVGDRWPGIAAELRNQFREIRQRKGNWAAVTAIRVDEFVEDPSTYFYKDLQKAARKADVWPAVRESILHYLETGRLPSKKKSWPLPDAELPPIKKRRKDTFPMVDVLLDIALYEKRTADVLAWYKKDQTQRTGWSWIGRKDDEVADAVKKEFPERAVEIWKQLAERQIALVKPAAYREAAVFLRKIRRLLKQQEKDKEWESYLEKLRQSHVRKRLLMEILDGLESKPIVKSG